MTLDRTTARMFKGIVFTLVLAAAFIGLYAFMAPSEADIERAAARVRSERHPPERRDPFFAWPQVTRWHFVTHLPIAGEVNRYRWRAQAEYAHSLDPDRDRMVNFQLETLGGEDRIKLVSPIVLFNKKARILSSEVPTRVTFSWGTVDSDTMRLELDSVNAFFDENVLVEAVREKAPGGFFGADGTNDDSSNDTGNAADDAADDAEQGDTDAAESAKAPLRITADHFEILAAKDTGIFTGNVVAKDKSGTIWADKMIVLYYSDAEKKADPSRTGMKRVTCIGHVRIDQKTEQAKCDQAVFDIQTNIVTMTKSKTAQVVYRKEDGDDKLQILADKVIIDRNPGGKTQWHDNVKVVDFSESRESFLGVPEKDTETETPRDDASGPTQD